MIWTKRDYVHVWSPGLERLLALAGKNMVTAENVKLGVSNDP